MEWISTILNTDIQQLQSQSKYRWWGDYSECEDCYMLVSGIDMLDNGNSSFARTSTIRTTDTKMVLESYKFPFFWFIRSDTSRLIPRFGS